MKNLDSSTYLSAQNGWVVVTLICANGLTSPTSVVPAVVASVDESFKNVPRLPDNQFCPYPFLYICTSSTQWMISTNGHQKTRAVRWENRTLVRLL